MKKLKPVIFLLLILALPILVQAQPDFEDDVQDVPLDGGTTLLLATGVAYGIKRYRDRQNKKRKTTED